MRAVHVFAAFAALVLVASGAGVYATSVPPPVGVSTSFASQIDHVVIIMMENRAYDNYFAGYCLQRNSYCNSTAAGIPAGECVQQMNVSGGCVTPYNFTAKNLSTPDLLHVYNNTVRSINGGMMNGFYSAENTGGVPRLQPFGHYNGSTIPVYWDMAQEFALGDNFYSSALSYSLPNHWYLLAGRAPSIVIKTTLWNDNITQKRTYLNQSNSTRTVEDLLNNSAVSFKYYDWPLVSYSSAIQIIPGYISGPGKGSAYSLWNPMAARAESYTRYFNSHFVARDQIFSDLKGGTLPNVSYVIPQGNYSDHAPSNITAGEKFVANVVDAVEFSKYWNHTAIFLAWDDYGGWYDGKAPPKLDTLGLSIRVPLIVISPYTPAGRIVHSLGYLESTLSFIEFRWGLKKDCLTARDCNAPDLAAYFDFSMKPQAPVFFDPNWLNDTYPYHHETYKAGNLDATTWLGNDDNLTDDEAD